MKRRRTDPITPVPPPLTAVRLVCAHHATFAISGGCVAVDAIGSFLELPATRATVTLATTLGSVSLLERLVYRAQSIQGTDVVLLEHWLTKAAHTAAEYGHVDLVRRLLGYSTTRASLSSYWTLCAEAVVEGAVTGGQVAILQEMATTLGMDHVLAVVRSLQVSVTCADVMQWLQSVGMDLDAYEFVLPRHRSEDEVLAGLESARTNYRHRFEEWSLLAPAASAGYARVVRYLVDDCHAEVTSDVIMAWCTGANRARDVLQYLLSHAPDSLTIPNVLRLVEVNALDSLELLLTRWPSLWRHEYHDQHHRAVCKLELAVATGSRAAVQWVIQYNRAHDNLPGMLAPDARMIGRAAANGHLEMVQWLHNHSRADWDGSWPGVLEDEDPIERLEWYYGEEEVDEGEGAIRNGHIDVVRWLWVNRPHSLSLYYTAVAANGHLPVLQFLDEHSFFVAEDDQDEDQVYEMEEEKQHLFSTAISRGQLEVAMWCRARWGKACTRTEVLCDHPNDFAAFKWAHANDVATRPVEHDTIGFIRQANHLVSCARVGVNEWLVQNGLLEQEAADSLIKIVRRGDLYTLQWFAARVPELIDWGVLQLAAERSKQDHIVTWLATRDT